MQHDRRPSTLEIFDFDSTLFLSPLLSSNLWDSSFVNSITQENLLGPGWWRDIRSLMVEEDGTWSNCWNEKVVKEVRKSSADPTRMTVLLTGRRYHPFHTIIERMLASKGLEFDLVGLRPDPVTDGPDHPNGLMFNDEPDVFNTTMDFKTSFIVHMLHSIPSLRNVVMWDDRRSHICLFQTYLQEMMKKGIIDKGHVECVAPLRPRYNPEWELKTINNIIKTHNEAILSLRQKNQQVENRVTIQNLDQSFTSCDLYELTTYDSHITLQLSKDTQHYLRSVFSSSPSTAAVIAEWENSHAEQPVFFGNEILLVMNEEEKKELLKTQFNIELGQQVSFEILQRSKTTGDHPGLVLRVKLLIPSAPEHFFILPLWYKPSEFNLLITQNYEWIDIDNATLDSSILQGVVGYHQLYILRAFQ